MLIKILSILLLCTVCGHGQTVQFGLKDHAFDSLDYKNYKDRFFGGSVIRQYNEGKENWPILSASGGEPVHINTGLGNIYGKDFKPNKFKMQPEKNSWGTEPKDEVYDPGGQSIQRNNQGRRDPFRVDTLVQMDDGIVHIRLNRRDMRYKITAPSQGQEPIILVTGKEADSVKYTYRGSVVALKDNKYVKITSSDTLDNTWVYVTMLMK